MGPAPQRSAESAADELVITAHSFLPARNSAPAKLGSLRTLRFIVNRDLSFLPLRNGHMQLDRVIPFHWECNTRLPPTPRPDSSPPGFPLA